MHIEIFEMSFDDLDDVCRIENETFSDPWPRAAFEDDMRSELTYCPVAKLASGELVGYANLMIFADEAHLTNIAVAPQRRRSGIGRFMMDHLIEKATSAGCHAMFLDVRASNDSAISLYRRYNFNELYRRKRYYCNPPEDAIVMVLPLGERNSDG
jgi:ribosomal-protein-alanine N-acetyltransferase